MVRRVPLSGARSPRGWVAGSRLRFVFCVIGFAGFLCGFRFRSVAFMPSKNAVSGRFWVRALSNLCRCLAAADFSLCALRFCACVCVFVPARSFEFFVVSKNYFLSRGAWFEFFFAFRALVARRAARV